MCRRSSSSSDNASRGYLWASAIAIVALATGVFAEAPKVFLYNPSASTPRGWYALTPLREPRIGAVALVRLPPSVAQLANERGYLPLGVPALKRIAATGGDYVCERHGVIQINDRLEAAALRQDQAGRLLTPWHGCRRLQPDEVFLLNTTHIASFDSRYYGPLPMSSIAGEAIPLWVER